MSYSCPLCHAPLSRSDNHYSCPQRHQFDLAKEGYVNLLPVQFKRSRDPGDSAEMMQARRAFLDAGHYRPLRRAEALPPRQRRAQPGEGGGSRSQPLLVDKGSTTLRRLAPGADRASRPGVDRGRTACDRKYLMLC